MNLPRISVSLVIGIAFAGASKLWAQPLPAYVPTSQLKAWYAFSGNANDASGNNHHGSPRGVADTTDRRNTSREAYVFNGNAEVMVGLHPDFNLNNMTFAGWVFLTNNTTGGNDGWQTVMCKYDQNYGMGGLYIYANVASMYLNSRDSIIDMDLRSKDTLALNRWYHLAGTHSYDSGTRIYINGVLSNSDKLKFNAMLASKDSFRIGSQGPFYPCALTNGRLDELGVWSRALTSAEINAMFLAASASNPQFKYRFSPGLFPNPVKDKLQILLPDLDRDAQIDIFDLQGSMVKTFTVQKPSKTAELAVQDLAAGTYYLRLMNGRNILGTGSFIKCKD